MKLNICPVPQTVKFALSSPRLRTWCLANGAVAVQRGSIVQDRAFNYIKSYSTPSNFDAALIRISISLRQETFAKNMAQGLRSVKPHPPSIDKTQLEQIDHHRSWHGLLRFYLVPEYMVPLSFEPRGSPRALVFCTSYHLLGLIPAPFHQIQTRR